MQIVFAIEEKFGVRFSEEQIPRLDSFPKIVDCVYSQNAS
jgi:acyl carrier protein